jgi:hypothetical protein
MGSLLFISWLILGLHGRTDNKALKGYFNTVTDLDATERAKIMGANVTEETLMIVFILRMYSLVMKLLMIDTLRDGFTVDDATKTADVYSE